MDDILLQFVVACGIGLIVLLPVLYFLERYNHNAKKVVETWDKAFPSLEKAMEGKKE